jgi:hypothetical protein
MFRGNCIGGKARTGGDFIHVTLSGKIGRPMELRDPIRSVLKHKGGNVWAVPPSASVYDAIAMMGEKQVGALLVIEDAKLVGILSDRDYARKILKGRSSKETPVGEIVTSPVRYVTPQETVDECMRIMTASRVRHLPMVLSRPTTSLRIWTLFPPRRRSTIVGYCWAASHSSFRRPPS